MFMLNYSTNAKSIAAGILLLWFLSLASAWFAGGRYQTMRICQYAKDRHVDPQTDVAVSQKDLWLTMEQVECEGEIRLYRNVAGEAQNFTVFFPVGKYVVETKEAGGVLNVVFKKPELVE